jgi:hypothetical protein
MCDACFSIDSFFSLCTQPTKVAQTIKASPQVAEPTSHGMPETVLAKSDATLEPPGSGVPVWWQTRMATSTSSPSTHRKPGHDWNASRYFRHALVAPAIAESTGSSHRCSVVTPLPAPASHFEDFFGVSAPSDGQQLCGAEVCGAFCRPALLEARCPYAINDDVRLYELLELLKHT